MRRHLVTKTWRERRPGGSQAARGRPRRLAALAAALVLGPAAALAVVTGLAAPASATTVPAPPSGWTTAFSDSFSGASGSGVDSQWTYDTGTQYNGTGCTANFGTGEVESNTNSTANVSEDGAGHLNITAVKSGSSWTSGRIETVADNFAAPAGGEMEVSASIKQPNPSTGLGYWPAFWMLGSGFRSSGAGTSGTMDCSNWPSTGEIDIMEDVNALSEHSGTLHCGTDPGGPCNETTGQSSGLQACSGCQTGYNTYSVIVNRTNTSAESITYYLNGTAYYTVTEATVGTSAWQAAVDHGFFLILDLAMGGAYPDAICGCTAPSSSTSSGAAMSVGYVAVYTTTGSGGGTTAPAAPTGLTVTGTTSSSASLSWTPPSGTVTGYYVDENGSQVASVTGTTATITGLAASTTYSFTVIAYNSAGNSPASSAVSATTSSSGGGGGGKSCTTTATSDISADCYSASQGTINVTTTSDSDPSGVDGNQASQLANGDYLEYGSVNFGSTGSTQFDARVASGASGGVSGLVEVVLDNPSNAAAGSFAIANTGGWSTWETVPANITKVTGTHNVYLEFVSGATGNPAFVSLHYFNFPAT